jgi:BolA protein
MTIEETLHNKFTSEFSPLHFELDNESYKHNVPKGSESHFKAVIVSELFEGMPRIRRHQAAYAVAADELAGAVHALALHTFTPTEWRARQQKAEASPNCKGGTGL